MRWFETRVSRVTPQYDRHPDLHPTETAEPGSLSDPEYPGYLRYWDGEGWTAQRYKLPRDKSIWVA